MRDPPHRNYAKMKPTRKLEPNHELTATISTRYLRMAQI